MATEDYFSKSTPPSGPGILVQPAAGPAMPELETGAAAVGTAIAEAGKVAQAISIKWANSEDHVRATLALTDFAVQANALEHGSSNDPNYFVSSDKLKISLEALKKEKLETIQDPIRRSDADRSMTMRIIAGVNAAASAGRSRAISAQSGAADALDANALTQFSANMEDKAKQQAILADRYAQIDKDVQAGMYTGHAGFQRKAKIGHETSLAEVYYDGRADPAGTVARLADPKNYPGIQPAQRQSLGAHYDGQVLQAKSDDFRLQAQKDVPAVRGIVEMATRPQEDPGLVTPGNINLLDVQPVADPATGQPMTVKSMSFEQDGKQILIPTVVGGKALTPDQAIAQYNKPPEQGGGKHFGIFNTAEEASQASEALHRKQSILTDTPAGRTLLSMPPHMRYRTVEGAKGDINALDSNATQQAIRLAAYNRDTDNVVEVLKQKGDVADIRIKNALELNNAACNRGNQAACTYLGELNQLIQMRPFQLAARGMEIPRLEAEVTRIRGNLEAIGADPNAAQFKALKQLEAVLQENKRAQKEEPILLGQGSGAYTIGPADLAAAAAGDPLASRALRERGLQAEQTRRAQGGDGNPWMKAEKDQWSAQWSNAGAAGQHAILRALAGAMPTRETYIAAVTAIGGEKYATENVRKILFQQPTIAADIVRGGVLRATDERAKEASESVRSDLLSHIDTKGGLFVNPSQQTQAIEMTLDLDTQRRQNQGKLYDKNATGGLQQAWDDINGPIETLNYRKTPITPGLPVGKFKDAWINLNPSETTRMGGVFDRTGRELTAAQLGSGAVLRPTEPGSSVYWVGMYRPGAADEFVGFLDASGNPSRVDMKGVIERYVPPAAQPMTTGAPARKATEGGPGFLGPGSAQPATTAQQFVPSPQEELLSGRQVLSPQQQAAQADFDRQVLADMRKTHPNETDDQLQHRLDVVNEAMGRDVARQQMQLFYPTPENTPGLDVDAFANAVEGFPMSQNVEDRRLEHTQRAMSSRRATTGDRQR